MSGLDFFFGLVVGFFSGALICGSWLLRKQDAHFAALMEQARCTH